MRQTLSAVAFVAAMMPLAANALGYPIPQPKPCAHYWDSAKAQRLVASKADVVAYLAWPREVIALVRPPKGLEPGGPYVLRLWPSDKGCAMAKLYTGRQALGFASLFARQGES